MPIESVNDFVVRFANVNGSGSASANLLFAKSIMRMGVPIAPRRFPVWFPAVLVLVLIALVVGLVDHFAHRREDAEVA